MWARGTNLKPANDRATDARVNFLLPGQEQAILLRELGDVKVMGPLKKKK